MVIPFWRMSELLISQLTRGTVEYKRKEKEFQGEAWSGDNFLKRRGCIGCGATLQGLRTRTRTRMAFGPVNGMAAGRKGR